jgi:hypothetical protein
LVDGIGSLCSLEKVTALTRAERVGSGLSSGSKQCHPIPEGQKWSLFRRVEERASRHIMEQTRLRELSSLATENYRGLSNQWRTKSRLEKRLGGRNWATASNANAFPASPDRDVAVQSGIPPKLADHDEF